MVRRGTRGRNSIKAIPGLGIMKSKRRHELQTNELADTLGQWIERVRPHMTMIVLLVVGVVAILAAWYYVAYSRESERAQAWRSYMDAGSDPQSDPVSELNAVADRYCGYGGRSVGRSDSRRSRIRTRGSFAVSGSCQGGDESQRGRKHLSRHLGQQADCPVPDAAASCESRPG